MDCDHMISLTGLLWILQFVHDGEIDPFLILFSGVAWFHIHEEANSQKNGIWSSVV
jgi:hypothetical protein